MKFSKIEPPKSTPRVTDPIALFQSLRVTDAAINDLWLAQGDALREWDKQRAVDDAAVVLNTGAGKTLVGLLAAQSLVNETRGRVVYACSSIQLVQQTASKASGYGLRTTTYASGSFDNDLYQRGVAPCITTYHALFNGRSRFFNEGISAVVFDDAHAAGHLLRDQFTLRIAHTTFAESFTQLVQLFRPYFVRIGQEMGYIETQDRQDSWTTWFVPPFALRQVYGELQRILRATALRDSTETMFAWEYLRDRLDLCATFVSGTDIVFTPPVVPVRTLPYFNKGVRRLYLSATLTATDAFVRSFGRQPDVVIAPSTTAGECERLILIPALHESRRSVGSDVEAAQHIVRDYKSLVLVPSLRRAREWEGIRTKYVTGVHEQVEEFRAASAPACLVLTARFDGVDLPGDTCRVLVIDDLPTGLNPLERYLWERLGLLRLLRSTVASRVVQSFGRISRGMSDHGVVVLTGARLLDWLLSPTNQSVLPEFLQRQLQLGFHLMQDGDSGNSVDDLKGAAAQCLSRDQDWIDFYQRSMESLEATPESAEDAAETLLTTKTETEFGHEYWARNFEAAAKVLESQLERTFTTSRPTGAWHALWLGYSYELIGDTERARSLYDRAHGAMPSIPAYESRGPAATGTEYSSQVVAAASLLLSGDTAHLKFPERLDRDLQALDNDEATVRQTEAALEMLGVYLGFQSQRPDNEVGTGPDVLWLVAEATALSMEAKTDKGPTAFYTKRDLGQLRDHQQWISEQFGFADVRSTFVGPVRPASPDSNPDPNMMIIELAQFRDLKDRLRAALIDICASGLPISAERTVQDVFAERNLLWPALYDRLEMHVLRDVPATP